MHQNSFGGRASRGPIGERAVSSPRPPREKKGKGREEKGKEGGRMNPQCEILKHYWLTRGPIQSEQTDTCSEALSIIRNGVVDEWPDQQTYSKYVTLIRLTRQRYASRLTLKPGPMR